MSKNEEWFYTGRAGKQEGPASKKEIQKLIATKMVPESAMVWKQGMVNWTPFSQVDELKAKQSNTQPPVLQSFSGKKKEVNPYETPNSTRNQKSEVNPYTPPKTKNTKTKKHTGNEISYGGINRIWHLILSTLLLAGYITALFLDYGVNPKTGEPTIIALITVSLISLFIVGARLKNTGMSPWASLLSYVPFLNFYIGIRCIAFPEGYSDSRKLDLAGKIIIFLFIALIVLSVLLVFWLEKQS
ncbi:MAG: GYF domain-containing protein [Akkermansiaceae bacterium]